MSYENQREDGVVRDLTAAELREEARHARRIADEISRQARAAQLAEDAARRPVEPVVMDVPSTTTVMTTSTASGWTATGTWITFERYQSGRAYHYAAVAWRTGSLVRWAVTGEETRRFTWAGLLAWIGEANWGSLAVVTERETLLPPGAEPAAAEVMGRYGRVLRTETVDPEGGDYR